MKVHHPFTRRGGLVSALITLSAFNAAQAQVTVDGVRNGSDTGYIQRAVQQTTSGWGNDNALANLHAVQDGADLAVFIGGKAQNNAILLFIDSKAGGVNFITDNLIVSGGEEFTINNLGSSSTAGMKFESGFNPDFVVRIFGNGAGTSSFVNRYNLQTGVRNYVGQADTTSPAASDFVTAIRSVWAGIPTPYASITTGVEMKLGLAGLGVPTGAAQPIKLMAILVNDNSTYASNQVLDSRTSSTDDIGGGIKTIDFEIEAGIQTISLTVDNVDTDNDGLPNDIDPDDDNDLLLDPVETNTGTYLSPSDTGTHPLVVDTDADGFNDFAEINAPYPLGFLSNPNVPSFASMAVPGNYTDPQWQVDGSAGNAMVRKGNSVADQNDWSLDFKIGAPGQIQYKYAANGSYTNSWGTSAPSGNYETNIAASGFHRFVFNDKTPVVGTLTRITYPTLAEYLTAYNVSASDNADGDGWTAAEEYLANTDPTKADSDGDTTPDHLDAEPLVAEIVIRDIVFSVDMKVQAALGLFVLGSDTVVVDFFDGPAGSLSNLPLDDENMDGIYTGFLINYTGTVGSSFGSYKFKSTNSSAPSNGFEGNISNRTFNLQAGEAPLDLPVVFFDNNNGFSGWAAANAGGQGASQDFDGDGVANGVEYFMGQTGSSFTPNPQPVGGLITWPHSATAYGAAFKVWISDNLATWQNKTVDAVDAGGFVTYVLPAGDPKVFVRLEVVTP